MIKSKKVRKSVKQCIEILSSVLEKCGGPGSGVPGPCPDPHAAGGGAKPTGAAKPTAAGKPGAGIKNEPKTKTPPPPFRVDVEAKGPMGVTKSARVGVPGDLVPPKPPIGRLANLTPKERKVEDAWNKRCERNPDKMAAQYTEKVKAGTKPGEPPVFETDGVKQLNSAWMHPNPVTRAKNRATLNTALHQTANAVCKRAFLKHLDTLKPGDEVLVTVGGCGAGKGYAMGKDKEGKPFVPEAFELKKKCKAVWDSAGDQNATENPWIQKELEKRGLKGNYVHVSADPKNQWADPNMGVIKRAGNPADGRMVDAKVFADSYAIGNKNHKAFHEANKNNKNANFVFIQNGKTPKKIDTIPEEGLKLDRHELADFAIGAVAGAKAPPHVKRGALVGTRIWEGD